MDSVADVVTLGELLIDFIADEPGVGVGETERFVAAAGGAPANVAVGAARLGTSAAFLGKVGDDPFGRRLAADLAAEAVDVSGLRFDPDVRTALAFVALGVDGEREFSFYRHPSADMLYRPEEVDLDAVRAAKILHFGSISLIAEPSRSATLAAVAAAQEAGVRTTYDPNLRLALWTEESAARAGLRLGLELANVVKVSEEELSFLTGDIVPEAARSLLMPRHELLVVTRGPGGAEIHTDSGYLQIPGFAVTPLDTTGAGDSFVAALLSALASEPELPRRPALLEAAVRHANACAALTTTRRGAIPALPRSAEVSEFLAQTETGARKQGSGTPGTA